MGPEIVVVDEIVEELGGEVVEGRSNRISTSERDAPSADRSPNAVISPPGSIVSANVTSIPAKLISNPSMSGRLNPEPGVTVSASVKEPVTEAEVKSGEGSSIEMFIACN